MKLKIFLASVVVLLSLVGYKTYRETQALKSIDSYGACVTAEGSVIQESYPATCVTRLGRTFTQVISDSPDKITTMTNWLHVPGLVDSSYVSSVAKLSLSFPTPMYVAEVFDSSDSINGSGYITISKNMNIESEGNSYLQISYGIPYIDGKGGACLEGYVTKTILGQQIEVCDKPGYYSSGYPIHPNGNIEYWFTTSGSTKSDDQMFREIIYSAKFTN